jgi:hypothetical protein
LILSHKITNIAFKKFYVYRSGESSDPFRKDNINKFEKGSEKGSEQGSEKLSHPFIIDRKNRSEKVLE